MTILQKLAGLSGQTAARTIMSKCTLTADGTLIGPDGKKAGHYDPKTGIGRCGLAAYMRMRKYDAPPQELYYAEEE